MSGITLAFPTPASLGSLDHYIQAVNRFPLLTAEQELDLGRRLKQNDDLDAARQLVLSHLRLVVAVSRNYMGYGLPQADLIQEGNVGLMKAVRRFDPERGVRLVSFALHWIKAEMHEHILRNWRLVKLATTKAQRKLFFNLRSMKTSSAALTRPPLEANLNTISDTTPAAIRAILIRCGYSSQCGRYAAVCVRAGNTCARAAAPKSYRLARSSQGL